MKKYSTMLVAPLILSCLLSTMPAKAGYVPSMESMPNLGIGTAYTFIKNNPKKTAIGALSAFLLASLFHYKAHKRPKKNNPTHYDLNLLDLDNLTVENLYYLWDELFIGIPGNGTDSAKVDPATKKIYWKEKSYPQGIMGWTDLYLVQTKKTTDAILNAGQYIGCAYLAYLLVKHYDTVANVTRETVANMDEETVANLIKKSASLS